MKSVSHRLDHRLVTGNPVPLLATQDSRSVRWLELQGMLRSNLRVCTEVCCFMQMVLVDDILTWLPRGTVVECLQALPSDEPTHVDHLAAAMGSVQAAATPTPPEPEVNAGARRVLQCSVMLPNATTVGRPSGTNRFVGWLQWGALEQMEPVGWMRCFLSPKSSLFVYIFNCFFCWSDWTTRPSSACLPLQMELPQMLV